MPSCSMRLLSAMLLASALSACGGGTGEETAAEKKALPAVAKATTGAAQVVESEYGTPVKDRVATIGLLNKRNNIVQDLVMKPGEARRLGNVVVRLQSCERTLPWERPAETGAFVQVYVQDRAKPEAALAWRTLFSGWLFRNAPSVNVVEHPVYDVWVKDCAMKFPGEDEALAPAMSDSSAAKPAGKASATPVAKPSPKPSPKPEEAPAETET